MKRIKYLIIFVAVSMLINVNATKGVNLINENTYIQQDSKATFENGVLALTSTEDEYLVNFSVPGLTNTYTWEGDIKITEIDETVGYSGVRFSIGYDEDAGNFLNILLTRNMGISANQRGTTPADDLHPLTPIDFTLTNDLTFHFVIVRDGAHVTLSIDDKTVMDYTFIEEYDLFTEGSDLNLGFNTCKCLYEVTNLAVYDEDAVVPTQTPTPEQTEEPTATPAPTATTKVTATPKPNDDNNISPVIIGVVAVAVIFAAVTVVLIVKNKRKV